LVAPSDVSFVCADASGRWTNPWRPERSAFIVLRLGPREAAGRTGAADDSLRSRGRRLPTTPIDGYYDERSARRGGGIPLRWQRLASLAGATQLARRSRCRWRARACCVEEEVGAGSDDHESEASAGAQPIHRTMRFRGTNRRSRRQGPYPPPGGGEVGLARGERGCRGCRESELRFHLWLCANGCRRSRGPAGEAAPRG